MIATQSSMASFLEKLEARSSFDAEERQAILQLPFHPRQVQTNRDFVTRGERVSHSCFVLEGMVGTFGQNRNGHRQITSVFMNGDMIDLQTVVVPEAMSNLQAITTTTILQVPHSDLRRVGHRYPNIAEAFWRECVLDAAIINEWVVNVGRRDARTRMAHLLCEVACRSGHARPENAFSFPFPATQAQLGDMLGLTPVHVNRTLKVLRSEQVVNIFARWVEILDWDRLADIGEFDATYLQLGSLKNGKAPTAARCASSVIQMAS
jgi:CRP-like cAMP-binding protein